jgi:hypothetical protein
MGSPISQVAQSTQTQPTGKGFPSPNPQSAGIENLNMEFDPQANEQFRQRQLGQPQGKGGRVTTPVTSGQPQMGQPSVGAGMPQPNMYTNTVGQWDNASIQPQQSRNRGGKGKG